MVKQERAVRTRKALIQSAAQVFDEDGFHAASLATISARAGVSNGALHFHFASKAELAAAVEEAAAVRLGDLMPELSNGASNPLQDLVDGSHALARGLAEDVVLRAGFELSGDRTRGEARDLWGQWRDWIACVIEKAAGEGTLDAGVRPTDVVTSVVAATVGLEVLGARDPDWLSQPTLTRFWQLLLPRLAAASVLAGLDAEGNGPVPALGGPGIPAPRNGNAAR
ncbi:ScbR family autoregulator-binding transcription factor [Streptomyces sp. NPDC002851]